MCGFCVYFNVVTVKELLEQGKRCLAKKENKKAIELFQKAIEMDSSCTVSICDCHKLTTLLDMLILSRLFFSCNRIGY